MKTVCLDLRALQIGHQNRGIGMYIKSVLEHLPEDPDIHYLFYCFENGNPVHDLGISTNVDYTLVTTPLINTVLDSPKNIFGIIKLVGHRFSALREHNPDTFVQFDFMLGIPKWGNIKNIVIGYDLIPLIMRNQYIPSIGYAWYHTHGKKAKVKAVLRSMYYNFRYKLQYRVFHKADKIICISKSTEESFKDILHIPSSKMTTIPLAPVLASGAPDSSLADKINKPFLFYIGGTDGRKKIQDIIYAFNVARGRGEDIALVLAGNEFKEVNHIPDVKGRNAILRSPYRNDIHLLGFISNEEKMGLYENALAFVFTTTYEGFGLPIIEAMSASCPVIAYDNSSIPEAAGDAALLVKTGDFVAIANKLAHITNKEIRMDMVKKGVSQSSKFNWNRYTEKFLNVL